MTHSRVSVTAQEQCRRMEGGCPPLLSVLVLNWNGERFLRPCFNSLLLESSPEVELILVDNGSTDQSVERVRKEFPQVRVIEHGQNLGFSRGYNKAVPQARGGILAFLNNDTTVEPGWWKPLVQMLSRRSEIGVLTCKLLLRNTETLNNAGGYFKLWTGGGELGYGREVDHFPSSKVIEPFFASGAAMAIRKETFEKLGGFDETLFAYGEDLDLSWRARLMGLKVRYVPESAVHHHHSGTWGVFNPQKVRLVTRHHLRAVLKCLSWPHLLHSVPAYVLFAIAKGLALSVIQRTPAYVTNVLLALWDLAAGCPEIWRSRRRVQAFRTISDRDALRSENFGLLDPPWEFLRILRVARQLNSRLRSALVENSAQEANDE